jgi:hypothetical protein
MNLHASTMNLGMVSARIKTLSKSFLGVRGAVGGDLIALMDAPIARSSLAFSDGAPLG